LRLRLLTTTYLEQAHFFRGEYQRVIELTTDNLAALPAGSDYESFESTGYIAIYNWFSILTSLTQLGRFVEAAPYEAEALRFAAEPLSLSEPLREDGDAELGDVVEDRSAESPFEVAATSLLPDEISRLLGPLDEREREILRLRFEEDLTQSEIGERIGVTQMHVSRLIRSAVARMRLQSQTAPPRDPRC